jgi:hypothetical protein
MDPAAPPDDPPTGGPYTMAKIRNAQQLSNVLDA